MGDLKVGEGFIDAIMIRVTATGAAAVGLAPTCILTRLSTGARAGLTVAEVGFGIYKVTDMAPAADDEYLTEWAVAGAYTIYTAFKLFKVGGGVIADWENGGRLDLILDAGALEATLAVVDGLVDDIIADIGAFPTVNYATVAAYVEDIRARLIAIVADTGELQTDWADGSRLDLLLDAVALEATLAVVDGIVDNILIDTDELQGDWADGGRLDLLIDAIKAKTDTIVWGNITTIDTLIDGIVADIGVFPSANYATLAAYVEDIRTRLIAIVGDTNELQVSLADGGFTDLLIDAIKAKTDNLPVDPADASDIAAAHALLATEAKQDIIDTNVDDIEADTNEIQISLADGGFTDLLIDAIKERTDNLPDDPADASDIAAAHALLATEAKQDIIDTNVDNLGTDVEEAHERAFLRRYPFVTTNESVSNAAEVDLAAPAVVTPTFPTGATRLNSYVVAILKANNQSAAEHNIGVTLQKNIAAGGWEDVRDFTASPPLTLPAVDATGDSVTFIEPVSVATGQTVQFRFQVDSDNAGEVHYTQVFFFAVEYDFQ